MLIHIMFRWTIVAQAVGTRHADRMYRCLGVMQDETDGFMIECAKRWHHSLDPNLDHSEWIPKDDARLLTAVEIYGRNWKIIGTKEFPGRSATDLKNRSVHS